MKTNFFVLQVYVPRRGYVTIFCYEGCRSNANRKFRTFLKRTSDLPSQVFRVETYKSVLDYFDDNPVRIIPFYP
nr:MAG TPA: hypothetical protein [Microviridae sp.]